MNYLERPGYCTRLEYDFGRSARLKSEQLELDQPYMLMLAGLDIKEEVLIKTPSSVQEVRALNAGMKIVKFTLLDHKLRPYHNGVAEFYDDLLVRTLDDPDPDDIELQEGYFQGFDYDWDGDLMNISAENLIPVLT